MMRRKYSYPLCGLNQTGKNNVQNLIVKKFSNISSVDISKVIEEVLKLMTKMSYILMIMVLLVSISGVLVVIAINYQQFLARRTDIKLLKLYWNTVKDDYYDTSHRITFASGSCKPSWVCVGLLSSFVLAKFVFDGVWSINYGAMLYIFGTIPSICCVISLVLSSYEATRKYKELAL